MAFALLLKFYGRHGRFPRGRGELLDQEVQFVAAQVNVPASDLGLYDWTAARSSTTARRSDSISDSGSARSRTRTISLWLASEVCESERQHDVVREELLARCRVERVEPPSPGRIDRIVKSARYQAEVALSYRIAGRLPPSTAERLATWPRTSKPAASI